MKLNPDCIRDILLSVEEATDGIRVFEYDKGNFIPDKLKKYDHNAILYHLQQCNMSELIVGFQPYDCGDYVIVGDLSPKGHEFLANIRSNSFWGRVKDIATKIGTPALGSLIQIAENLATDLISGYFQIK